MPSQEIIDQKNSAANAEQVSESNLELVPQPKQEHDTAASPQGLPHAFVVMPFGKKKGPDDRWIDFNSIYQDLIKPALIEAGFEPFRPARIARQRLGSPGPRWGAGGPGQGQQRKNRVAFVGRCLNPLKTWL